MWVYSGIQYCNAAVFSGIGKEIQLIYIINTVCSIFAIHGMQISRRVYDIIWDDAQNVTVEIDSVL